MKDLIDKLYENTSLSKGEYQYLIENFTPDISEYLFEKSREVRHKYYGHDIYVRGLIEFTNYCKNDCYYCGLRASNTDCDRFRLSDEQILGCVFQQIHVIGPD